jgi:allophanate hydrolase subunit 2
LLNAGFYQRQDLGRTGYREFGVSSGGALDSFGLRVANLLLGNAEGAAGLEITLGGLQLRFEDERVVAWCGGEFDVRIGSKALPAGHAGLVSAGEKLKIGPPKVGCRSWLSISGGIYVEPVLRSRSTDLRAGFGGYQGRALRDGDIVPLGVWPRSPAGYGISSWTAPHD